MANLSTSTTGARTTVHAESGRLLGHIIDIGHGQFVADVRPVDGAPVLVAVDGYAGGIDLFERLTTMPPDAEVPTGDARTSQISWITWADEGGELASLVIGTNERPGMADWSVRLVFTADELYPLVEALNFALARLAVNR